MTGCIRLCSSDSPTIDWFPSPSCSEARHIVDLPAANRLCGPRPPPSERQGFDGLDARGRRARWCHGSVARRVRPREPLPGSRVCDRLHQCSAARGSSGSENRHAISRGQSRNCLDWSTPIPRSTLQRALPGGTTSERRDHGDRPNARSRPAVRSGSRRCGPARHRSCGG